MRKYNVLAISATTTILEDLATGARLFLPTAIADQYASQIVPIFNMDCFE